MPTDLKLGAVILAAGLSKRYGTDNKLLAIVDGQPIIESVLKTVVTCQFDRVVVVVQSTDDAVGEIVKKRFPVTIAVNSQPSAGMGKSLAIGAGAIVGAGAIQGSDLKGIAIFPGDVPFIQPATINKLVEQFAKSGCAKIIRPMVGDQPGHPVLFPGNLIEELCQLTGDVGGRILIDRHPHLVKRVQVQDRGAVLDVDWPVDLDS